jgi:hypothetical protein
VRVKFRQQAHVIKDRCHNQRPLLPAPKPLL